jgi:hypothetical protein
MKRRQLTDEERAERRSQEQELTERAVAQLRCSEGWQRWLMVRGRVGLRRYSVRNQLLIALQRVTSHCLLGVMRLTFSPAEPRRSADSAIERSICTRWWRRLLVGPFVSGVLQHHPASKRAWS